MTCLPPAANEDARQKGSSEKSTDYNVQNPLQIEIMNGAVEEEETIHKSQGRRGEESK